MTDQPTTDRLASARRHAEMAKAAASRPDTFWRTLAEDTEFLLSLVDSLQGRLDTAEGRLAEVRELHQMERRYTDESQETSYNTPQEAAAALGITPGSAVYLDVCSHCGSIEMDAGADDYRESLWPCDTARALGLGEGDGQ